MSADTLKRVYQTLYRTKPQEFSTLLVELARQGDHDALRSALDSGFHNPRQPDLNTFVSIFYLEPYAQAKTAARELEAHWVATCKGIGPKKLTHYLAEKCLNAHVAAGLLRHGALAEDWIHSKSSDSSKTVLGTMLQRKTPGSIAVLKDLVRQNGSPSVSRNEQGEEKTVFDYWMDKTANPSAGPGLKQFDGALLDWMLSADAGDIPYQWQRAAGQALLNFTKDVGIFSFGHEEFQSKIMALASFTNPDEWQRVLARGNNKWAIVHKLVAESKLQPLAVRIFSNILRDGVHPDAMHNVLPASLERHACSLLECAAAANNAEVVKLLLESGANANATYNLDVKYANPAYKGMTALDFATLANAQDSARALSSWLAQQAVQGVLRQRSAVP